MKKEMHYQALSPRVLGRVLISHMIAQLLKHDTKVSLMQQEAVPLSDSLCLSQPASERLELED